MTCPDHANNRECLSLYNGKCILSEVRKNCALWLISRRHEIDTGDHIVDANKKKPANIPTLEELF